MKKVGILVYDFNATGGAERVAKNLAIELAKNSEIHVISLFESKVEEQAKEYKYVKMFDKTISITKNLLKISKKVKKYLKENKIDVLLIITAGVNSVGILATKGTNVKTIYCEHSNLENKTYGKRHIFRQWIGAKFADIVVTLTERDKENFKREFSVKEERIESIPNWIENKNNLKDIIYDSDSKKIITVGRLEKVKGYDNLLKVAKIVNEKHPDWTWDICGGGSLYEELSAKIKEEKLEKFLHLKGNVKNIEQIYKEYSFFVMTSYYEGLPLSLLEAQINKLPIISFDCPTGPSEIIANNQNGYLVDCYNAEQMATKINDLIENKEKRIEFSEKSNLNLKKYEKQEVLKKWNNLISKI